MCPMPKRVTKQKISQIGPKITDIWANFILSHRRETETKLPTLKIFLESVGQNMLPVQISAKLVEKWPIPSKCVWKSQIKQALSKFPD